MSKLIPVVLVIGLANIVPVSASDTDHMSMPMSDKPAHFEPKLSAYTANHEFLVKLTGLPNPIPYQKYFTVQFAVFDGHHPDNQLTNAQLTVSAGMRHGTKNGFAHGMQSAPKIAAKLGTITAEGIYFHMLGRWTLKVTITDGNRRGIAYFDLPCCGK